MTATDNHDLAPLPVLMTLDKTEYGWTPRENSSGFARRPYRVEVISVERDDAYDLVLLTKIQFVGPRGEGGTERHPARYALIDRKCGRFTLGQQQAMTVWPMRKREIEKKLGIKSRQVPHEPHPKTHRTRVRPTEARGRT